MDKRRGTGSGVWKVPIPLGGRGMLGMIIMTVLVSCNIPNSNNAPGERFGGVSPENTGGRTRTPNNPGTSKGRWDGVLTPRTPMDRSRPIVMGYFPSWTLGWIPDDGVTTMAKLPDHVNYVIFSFAKANLR